jgi:hypothetical protein
MTDPTALSARAVRDWLVNASPGDRLVYATGFTLPQNRFTGVREVRAAYNAGTVDLVQRRVGDFNLEYLVQVRRYRAKIEPECRFQMAGER